MIANLELKSPDELLDDIVRLHDRIARLRQAFDGIGYMDAFLDADCARHMMQIAREAIEADNEIAALTNGERG